MRAGAGWIGLDKKVKVFFSESVTSDISKCPPIKVSMEYIVLMTFDPFARYLGRNAGDAGVERGQEVKVTLCGIKPA